MRASIEPDKRQPVRRLICRLEPEQRFDQPGRHPEAPLCAYAGRLHLGEAAIGESLCAGRNGKQQKDEQTVSHTGSAAPAA